MGRTYEAEDASLIYDDTIVGKPYMDENDIICWHFDHKENKPVKGINFQNIFKTLIVEKHLKKLPESMRNYEQTIQNIGNKINYCIQKKRLGFGHAVYQCRNFYDGEPSPLLLGDTIYSSNEKRN